MEGTTPFPHFFLNGELEGGGVYPKTVDELDILRMEKEIREKPEWERKIQDVGILEKWRSEVGAMGIQRWEEKWEYVVQELNWLVESREDATGIMASTVDGTFHSDSLIDAALRDELIEAVKVLEDVPESQKDWHPGSSQVLDLVHPSLYPLIIGKSPVLRAPFEIDQANSSYGRLLYFAKESELLSPEEAIEQALKYTLGLADYTKSQKYQWLPSDVIVDLNGSARFTSYINNLHPELHGKLYHCLERCLSKFIPLFEKVLTSLRCPREPRCNAPCGDWYEYPERDEDYEGDYNEGRIMVPLIIPKYEPPKQPESIASVQLKGRSLQVIVKLANIHLTPENPEYLGGVWHLEGMANERIVASGIYYYSNENISDSSLHFRQVVTEPYYEQNDVDGVASVFGLADNQALNQVVGSISTKGGRCIAFPNTLQHRVSPFSLIDKSKRGHRKILVFFLVDPSCRIISTSRVPPQQRSWFLSEVEKDATLLPELVLRKIVGLLEFPFGIEEAKRIREELMQERKYFIQENNNTLFERPFSLCEH